nr:PREDICTED: acyl-coenzyme A thioesterase 13-like isoform X1 [Bemisia tabaci]
MSLQLVRTLLKHSVELGGFGKVLEKVSVVSVDHGKIVAEMKVEAEHLNVYNTLHGGLIATIVDVIPSLGHFTHPNGARGGSSATTNLDISYLNSAKVGDEIVITANTVKAGKTLAFLEAKITEKTSGKVIATATHIKFVKD